MCIFALKSTDRSTSSLVLDNEGRRIKNDTLRDKNQTITVSEPKQHKSEENGQRSRRSLKSMVGEQCSRVMRSNTVQTGTGISPEIPYM